VAIAQGGGATDVAERCGVVAASTLALATVSSYAREI
jgi:hypothetical protein